MQDRSLKEKHVFTPSLQKHAWFCLRWEMVRETVCFNPSLYLFACLQMDAYNDVRLYWYSYTNWLARYTKSTAVDNYPLLLWLDSTDNRRQ